MIDGTTTADAIRTSTGLIIKRYESQPEEPSVTRLFNDVSFKLIRGTLSSDRLGVVIRKTLKKAITYPEASESFPNIRGAMEVIPTLTVSEAFYATVRQCLRTAVEIRIPDFVGPGVRFESGDVSVSRPATFQLTKTGVTWPLIMKRES